MMKRFFSNFLEIATVACGDLAMTIAAFVNSPVKIQRAQC